MNLANHQNLLWHRHLAQAIDSLSSNTFGIAPTALMESAGRAVAAEALAMGAKEKKVVVLVGPGNNGADGLVAARVLADAGVSLVIGLIELDSKQSSALVAQLTTAKALGLPLVAVRDELQIDSLVLSGSLVVDAIFGLGFKGQFDPAHFAYRVLARVAQVPEVLVLAVDGPSGLNIDSAESKCPLQAHVTVTFGCKNGGQKPAHILAPSRDLCGYVHLADIGFPTAAVTKAAREEAFAFSLCDSTMLMADNKWEALSPSAHKYDRGHVLVVGGSPGKTGAPILAAMAALRAGAGWATVAMSADSLATLKGDVPPELTFEDLFEGGTLCATKLDAFLTTRHVKSVVIGPGSMKSDLTLAVIKVLQTFTTKKPNGKRGFVVLDAGATQGALTLLSQVPFVDERSGCWLLTPHPGEWTKLQESPLPSPLSIAALPHVFAAATLTGATLLHKGATPVVIGPELKDKSSIAYISTAGDKTLARAGSGDVLSGVAAAHGAIGYDAIHAALRGQALVAAAARLAALRCGEDAVLASDVIAELGHAST